MEPHAAEIFVHPQCPHCVNVIEKCDAAELSDITDIGNLKQFLAYRASLDGYADVRSQGKIGVPSKVIDGATVEFFDQV